MQPPGGPPGDKRHPLPPPWGNPGKPATPAPAPTTLPGGHGGPQQPVAPQPPHQPPAPQPIAPHPAQPVAPQQPYPWQQPQPPHAVPTAKPGPSPHPYPAPPQQPPPPAAYPPPPAQQPYPPPPPMGYPPPPTGHTPPPEKLPPPPMLSPLAAPAFPPPQGYPPPPPPGHGGHTPLPLAAPPDRPSQPLLPHAPPPPPPGHNFVDFLKISARRAIRLRIEENEVLPQERQELTALKPPIVDPGFQAFLAWRRSVLFVVACALIPLILLRILELVEMGDDPLMPDQLVTLNALPVIAEAIFCGIAFYQLRNWTRWQRQRRMLAIGFGIFFLSPFVIYLFPLSSFFSEQLEAMKTQFMAQGASPEEAEAAMAPGRGLIGIAMAIQAIMVLAPKAISLMPGLIRASLVSKMLFPGLSSPGWLMVLSAPVYSLLVYVVLIMPYQITGSGWFVGAIVAIIAAQYFLGRAGFTLAHPQSKDQAIATVRSARTSYLTSMVVGAAFIVIAFGSNLDMLNLDALSVVNLLLSFEASVLALTLIITDTVIAALDHARHLTENTDAVEAESEKHIQAFVSAAHGDDPTPP